MDNARVTPAAPVLDVRDIRVTRSGRRDNTVLVDVPRLTLRAGECTVLLGSSGAGKTLLLRALLRMVDLPLRGSFIPGDDPVPTMGYVNQDALSALDPLVRIEPQVTEAVRMRRSIAREALEARTAQALTAAGLTPNRALLRSYPHELSGGMRQRALIAAATIDHPTVLLADEPTTALDVTVQRRVLQTLRTLTDDARALLLVTHDRAVARHIADRVLVMEQGSIVGDVPARVFFGRAQAPAPASLSCAETTDRIRVGVTQLAVPESERAPRRKPASSVLPDHPPDAVLSFTNLTVRYPHATRPAVRGVTAQLRAGSTLGIVGESGSGKTTIALATLGLLGQRTGLELAVPDRRVQWVPQNARASFTPGTRVGAIVAEALGVGDRLAGRRRAHRATRQRRVADALAAVGLGGIDSRQFARSLSGGQAQRLAIARALAAEPALLVCDEPVSGLDEQTRHRIVSLLATRQRELGFGMLFISHELDSMQRLADELIVLHEGSVVEQGPAPQVFAAGAHSVTRALLGNLTSRV